jgi:hypothetical protein
MASQSMGMAEGFSAITQPCAENNAESMTPYD